MKRFSLVMVAVLDACGSHGGSATERYAVGTYLYTGDVIFGSTDCTFDAPPGVLDGSMILKPGTITETCKGGKNTIIAEYADHITPAFPTTAKVGEDVMFRFELRNAKNQQLTPTLSEMDDVKLADGCTALKDVDRGGAQDTGRDPFLSATAAAPGSCKVTMSIELPMADGSKKKLTADQVVTVKK